MSLRLLVGLYTLREPLAADVPGTLEGLAATGAREVELAGLHGNSPAAMRAALDAAGLAAGSAHVPLDRFEREPEAVFEEAATLGTGTLVVPVVPAPETTEAADAMVDRIAAARAATRAAGFGFAYHNHAFEFRPLPGGGDFWSRITAAGLEHEPDTGWLQVAGHDPVAVLGELSGRCPLVHAKDVRPAGEGWEDVPAGDGISDWPAIAAAAAAAGAWGIVVELDHPSADPLADVARSLATLAAAVELCGA
jgi:sugar phosphate isomerase/epimerase